MHTQERYQAILSCQIDEFCLDLSLKSDDIQPMLQKDLLALPMALQIVFHTEFSNLPGGLGHFEDSNSILWNLPTTFHPILVVAILLNYLLSLVERLFQRCHLSRIDEVLKCGDSMLDLHMLSQNSNELSV